jgi:two-component system, NarL family, nitrate/nitrite response regulator NarL
MPSEPIRVVVADSRPLLLDGLARAVCQDPRLVLAAAVRDGRSALDAIRRLRPDVAVLELPLPALDGRRVLAATRRESLPTEIVVLADGDHPDAAYDAVADGARGCISERAGADDIRDAIRRVGSGEGYVCRRLQSAVVDEIRLRRRGDRDLLQARHVDVLRLVAAGHATPAIGARLQVSHSTVKSICTEIFERLGVRDRPSAVAEAMRRGFLD